MKKMKKAMDILDRKHYVVKMIMCSSNKPERKITDIFFKIEIQHFLILIN